MNVSLLLSITRIRIVLWYRQSWGEIIQAKLLHNSQTLMAGQQPQKLLSFPPSQPTRFQSHQSGCCEQVGLLCGVIGAALGLGCPLLRPASAHSWLAQQRAAEWLLFLSGLKLKSCCRKLDSKSSEHSIWVCKRISGTQVKPHEGKKAIVHDCLCVDVIKYLNKWSMQGHANGPSRLLCFSELQLISLGSPASNTNRCWWRKSAEPQPVRFTVLFGVTTPPSPFPLFQVTLPPSNLAPRLYISKLYQSPAHRVISRLLVLNLTFASNKTCYSK